MFRLAMVQHHNKGSDSQNFEMLQEKWHLLTTLLALRVARPEVAFAVESQKALRHSSISVFMIWVSKNFGGTRTI
jgi:hypothetical protein